jgi:hypothetical protein
MKTGTMIRFLPSKNYPEGKDLKEYLDENGFASYYRSGIGTLTQTSLDGKKAIRIDTKLRTYDTSGDFTSTQYCVVNKGKFYEIVRLYTEGKQSEYESTFKSILYTFKFL